MKLVRTAVLTFKTGSDEWRQLMLFKMRGIEVRAMPYADQAGTLTLAVAAEVPLSSLPNVTADNRVEIPADARRKCERAIEAVANLIAVSENSRRTISAPYLCVALLPTSKRDRRWLSKRAGMAIPPTAKSIPRIPPRVARPLLRRLDDRSRGVALLAEALAHGHATGKFNELVRFFEHAFARPYNKLEKKLCQFLAGGGFGYTRTEIRGWLHEIRDLATHADERLDFALEATTRPVVSRMEQAAYDVLFNKKRWHDPSSERRRVWRPDGATTDDKGATTVRQRSTLTIEAQLFDIFGSYPIHMNVRPVFPEEAWIGDAKLGEMKSEQLPLKVVRARPRKTRPKPAPSPVTSTAGG